MQLRHKQAEDVYSVVSKRLKSLGLYNETQITPNLNLEEEIIPLETHRTRAELVTLISASERPKSTCVTDEDMDNLVKMTFHLTPHSWHGSATETLWVREVGPNLYKLENSPFYAFGVSFEDIVAGQNESSSVVFKETVHTGGHSTYRIILDPNRTEQFEDYWRDLQNIGCTFEEGPNQLYAVDIPPSTDIHAAYALLEKGERDGIWTFEEGHCGHLKSQQPS